MKRAEATRAGIATSILEAAAITFGLLASCGGGGGERACSGALTGSCTNGTGLFCVEYAGIPQAGVAPLMESCIGDAQDSDPGVWSSTEGCQRAGAVGACKEEQSGTCAAVWFYAGTSADFKPMCASMGGTWVGP
jgi:hypothetical protein